jgi:hypothetical protein
MRSSVRETVRPEDVFLCMSLLANAPMTLPTSVNWDFCWRSSVCDLHTVRSLLILKKKKVRSSQVPMTLPTIAYYDFCQRSGPYGTGGSVLALITGLLIQSSLLLTLKCYNSEVMHCLFLISCIVFAGPWMVSRSLASLRRPCILLCQEGAVEEPARTELGQRGRLGYSPFSINGILSILMFLWK